MPRATPIVTVVIYAVAISFARSNQHSTPARLACCVSAGVSRCILEADSASPIGVFSGWCVIPLRRPWPDPLRIHVLLMQVRGLPWCVPLWWWFAGGGWGGPAIGSLPVRVDAGFRVVTRASALGTNLIRSNALAPPGGGGGGSTGGPWRRMPENRHRRHCKADRTRFPGVDPGVPLDRPGAGEGCRGAPGLSSFVCADGGLRTCSSTKARGSCGRDAVVHCIRCQDVSFVQRVRFRGVPRPRLDEGLLCLAVNRPPDRRQEVPRFPKRLGQFFSQISVPPPSPGMDTIVTDLFWWVGVGGGGGLRGSR